MTKLNIALLHYSAPPVVGGVETVLAQQARLMTNAGHCVRVIAGRGEPWDERIELIRLPLVDSIHPEVLAVKSDLDAGRIPPEFALLVDQILESLQPVLAESDLLIAHNVCSLNKNLALTAALHRLNEETGCPRLALWHHDLAWASPHYLPELHEGYPWDLLRTGWTGVCHIVVSEPRRQELARLLNLSTRQIRIVPNGVELEDFFELEPETRALLGKINLEEAEPILLLPVRLTPGKNVELVLRTLAALQLHLPRAALVVIGPEELYHLSNVIARRRLLTLRDELGLAGKAHFILEHLAGFLPDFVVADFFRLADALILPSPEESFGIPLIKASLSRLPVFCIDSPPLRDLAREAATYFSPDAGPEAIAALIANRLQVDPVYRFAARARRNFSWQSIYTHHLAPLLKACSQEKRFPPGSGL